MKVDKEFIEYVEQIEQKLQYSFTNKLSDNEFGTMKFDIVQCFASMKEIIKAQNGIKNEPKEINF